MKSIFSEARLSLIFHFLNLSALTPNNIRSEGHNFFPTTLNSWRDKTIRKELESNQGPPTSQETTRTWLLQYEGCLEVRLWQTWQWSRSNRWFYSGWPCSCQQRNLKWNRSLRNSCGTAADRIPDDRAAASLNPVARPRSINWAAMWPRTSQQRIFFIDNWCLVQRFR